jgi:hypothetical protein
MQVNESDRKGQEDCNLDDLESRGCSFKGSSTTPNWYQGERSPMLVIVKRIIIGGRHVPH